MLPLRPNNSTAIINHTFYLIRLEMMMIFFDLGVRNNFLKSLIFQLSFAMEWFWFWYQLELEKDWRLKIFALQIIWKTLLFQLLIWYWFIKLIIPNPSYSFVLCLTRLRKFSTRGRNPILGATRLLNGTLPSSKKLQAF